MTTRTSAAPARIEDHALLGNCRTAALAAPDGTVDWLCMPGFDSPAVFTSLLSDAPEKHGFWRVGPAVIDTAPPSADSRRYVGSSTVLEQTWHTLTGTLTVTDFLVAPDATGYAPAQLMRIAACTEGSVTVASEIAVRPGYGANTPVLRPVAYGTPRIQFADGADTYWLDGAFHFNLYGRHYAEEALEAGQQRVFALTWCAAGDPVPTPPTGLELDATLAWWEEWASACTYTGPYRDAALRSLVTLKAMQDLATGAFVAAPTTSLPERLLRGLPGTAAPDEEQEWRTWDYRFFWPRDTAWYVRAFLDYGFVEEALAWREWILTHTDPAALRPLYRLDGSTDTAERTLDHLPGHLGVARPVRVGNGADGQLQLDVPGELLDTLWEMELHGLPGGPDVVEYALRLALQVEQTWHLRDCGMWESRGTPQHYTSSRIWCWVALDRAVKLLRRYGAHLATAQRLEVLAVYVRITVREAGADPRRSTLTQVCGGTDLDASVLHALTTGLLDPADPLATGTVEAVARELGAGPFGLVERYPTHENAANIDGLPGHEGTFLPCTAWLASARALTGDTEGARESIEVLLGIRTDLGLLPEQADSLDRRHQGNFPQGMSHEALLAALLDLQAAQHSTAPRELALAQAAS
ncbi:glycoside hydrolase family 15 protein [Streptomyces sp. TLI_171]|uniref:glycoside hydrolase family 15 protein n=1 Tax=Streptomyces sp. TLI_171 TaxID=1938859 RepID=UPI000C1982BC|nr:glycoside hydrolase family 15 protein [Streptomyces sp. TLI_171]RKE21940.1 GH15 family glucan-1,4-alpha-glucosidase [Streptomyces sp. TLI_171]